LDVTVDGAGETVTVLLGCESADAMGVAMTSAAAASATPVPSVRARFMVAHIR
jgi:hypothetical protein